jgi:hypothetical protein
VQQPFGHLALFPSQPEQLTSGPISSEAQSSLLIVFLPLASLRTNQDIAVHHIKEEELRPMGVSI